MAIARYARLLRSLARVKLLILDDWGPEALTADQARDLLEIVEDRYDKGSIIITSQVPVDRWHDLIGIPTLADAILDRVIHNAYRIELAGESLRKQRPIAMRPGSAIKAASRHPRRDKAVDNDGLRYGAMESALRPSLPTATRSGPSRTRTFFSIYGGPNPSPLDQSGQAETSSLRSAEADARWPTSNRNPGRLQIGISGRLPIGMCGRLRRNPQAVGWRRSRGA